ncbi:hypothetical protein A8H36_06995 [Burkholderia thailandensis]|nr:hypothetical protein A8H36_06995 [Burkholderia thailandensis]
MGANDIAHAIRKAFHDNVKPAKGVVLVTGTEPTISPFAMTAIANDICAGGTIADLPVRSVSTVTYLHSSDSRDAESIKAYASKDIQTGKLKSVAIDNCRSFNPLAPEGVHLTVCHLTPETALFARVAYKDLKRDDAIAALADLNAEAERLGALVVIYVQHTKKQDVTWLQEHSGVSVEVGKCEPGPGAQIALTLINVSLASWHAQGIGRVMVEAFLESDGGWTYRREPLIAERAVIRLAWYMAYEDMTLREIAKVVGIYASNVSRGFQLLSIQPKNAPGLAPPADWRTRWARCYSLDIGDVEVKQAPTDTDAPSDATGPLSISHDTSQSLPRRTGIGKEPATLEASVAKQTKRIG